MFKGIISILFLFRIPDFTRMPIGRKYILALPEIHLDWPAASIGADDFFRTQSHICGKEYPQRFRIPECLFGITEKYLRIRVSFSQMKGEITRFFDGFREDIRSGFMGVNLGRGPAHISRFSPYPVQSISRQPLNLYYNILHADRLHCFPLTFHKTLNIRHITSRTLLISVHRPPFACPYLALHL